MTTRPKRKRPKRETARERCDRHRLKSKFFHVYKSVGDPPCAACRRATKEARAKDSNHGGPRS